MSGKALIIRGSGQIGRALAPRLAWRRQDGTWWLLIAAHGRFRRSFVNKLVMAPSVETIRRS